MPIKLFSELALAVLIFLSGIAVCAAPSDLDTPFGNSGISLSSLNNNAAAIERIMLLPDGKIIGVGNVRVADRDFMVARFNYDGSLDQTFGVGGMTVIPLLNDDTVKTGLLLPDGKIIIAGSSYAHFAMVRVAKDGELDTTFGNNGVVITNVGVSLVTAVINAIGLQSDGRIVAAGNCHSYDICIARYLPDGSLDTSFGGIGWISMRYTSQTNEANALTIQSDGKILVGGFVSTAFGTDALLLRYNVDGTLDGGFDGDGIKAQRVSGFDRITALFSRPDGKIVSVGAGVNKAENVVRFSLIGFNSDGTLDPSFGTNGISFEGNPPAGDVGGAAQDTDGKLLIAAARRLNSQNISALQVARFNANGRPDVTFGNNGSRCVTTRTQAGGNSVAVQPDGKIVVGGYGTSAPGGGLDLALARFVGGDSSLPSESTISGQVLLNGGVRFKGSVRLVLTSSGLQYPLYAQTNPFGFFNFARVPTGSTYEIRPVSKTYLFYEPAQTVLLYDTISDVYVLAYFLR